MATITHKITLSTTDFNLVGDIKVRQADDETQVFDAVILEHGMIKNFEGLKPFFCLMAREITGQGVSEEPVTDYDGSKGTLKYTVSANAMQMVGRNEAYFSFRKESSSGRWVEQFSTKSFFYVVEKSIYTQPFKDSNYWFTFTELYRKFMEYQDEGKVSWEEFVDQNREILESIDPGGTILTELIDARKPLEGASFSNLSERLNNTDSILETVEKFPVLEYEKTYVVNPAFSYDNLRRYGITEDDGTVETAVYNFQCMKNFMDIYQEGKEYYLNSYGKFTFKGDKGFVFDKSIKLRGVGNPRLFFITDDGSAFTFLARHTFISGFDITNNSSVKGDGIKFAPSSGYNAYCQAWDNKTTGFNIGFYAGDSFDVSFRNCLARDCNIGFRISNVTTMLNSQNCYSLRCGIGHNYDKCYYATIINIACDESTSVPYIFNDMHSTIVTSLGQENNKNSIRITNSDMVFFGVTGDGNIVDAGYGSMMTINSGSKITLIGAIERRIGEGSLATTSIVVDATSILTIDNSRFLKEAFLAPGGQIDGVFRVNNTETRYDRGKRVTFGSQPPTSGARRLGDIHYNDNISLQTNPVQGWVCVAAGTPGDWRPFGLLVNRGTLDNRPALSGWNHLGYKYIVFATGVSPYEITWTGSNWIKNDGTVVS